MDINARKSTLIEWLTSLQDSESIGMLENLKKELSSQKDWWESLPEDRKTIIEESSRQAKAGETIPHEIVMTKLRTKYLKNK